MVVAHQLIHKGSLHHPEILPPFLCDHDLIDKIVPPGTGSSRSNPESSKTVLLSCSFKLLLPAVLSGRQRKELADVKPPSGITYFNI